jgi:hypothetical protein
MRGHSGTMLSLLSVGPLIIPAASQSTGTELRPELGIYVQQGPIVRFDFVDSASGNLSRSEWQGRFDFYVNVALKPVFRRELRDQPDVYRNKYLTMRAGYRQVASFTNGNSSSESRGIVEVTSRYLLPWQLAIADRNRGEFRFIKGQGFSTRYRNRLRLERDIQTHSLGFTPYIFDETFYDTRYDEWTPNRYGAGIQFPVGPHVVLEPYYFRQNGSHSNPPHINALAFTVSLYF